MNDLRAKPGYNPDVNIYNTHYSPIGQMEVRESYIYSLLSEMSKMKPSSVDKDVFIKNVQAGFKNYGFAREVINDLDKVRDLDQLKRFLDSFIGF